MSGDFIAMGVPAALMGSAAARFTAGLRFCDAIGRGPRVSGIQQSSWVRNRSTAAFAT
jgi:hypothetical protein